MAKSRHKQRYRELRETRGIEAAYSEALSELGILHEAQAVTRKLVIDALLILPRSPENEKARAELAKLVKTSTP